MRKTGFSNTLNIFTRYKDFCFFGGLLLWLSIFCALEAPPASWKEYLSYILVFGFVLSPALIFAWYKPLFKEGLERKHYLYYWLAAFGLCLPVTTIAFIILRPFGYSGGLYFIAGFSGLLMELLLEANLYYQQRIKQRHWLKRLDLDTAVLISLVLISVVLGAAGVSSLEKPEYINKGYLLIYIEFNPKLFFGHFWTFLSFSFQFMLMYMGGYVFFYINSHLLVSKVLKEQGAMAYALGVLVTIAFLYPLVAQLIILLPLNRLMGGILSDDPFKLENAFAALCIMVVSLPIILALQWARQNTRIISLEKEKTQTELDLLRQQLNPHFFFNTLNNLYALSLQQSKEAPESILQLSELMRYVIYRGKEEKVRIHEELKYINDYIQLQQLRLRKIMDLTIDITLYDEDLPIAPLLLIIFVENAFKHGIEPAQDKARLNICLKTEKNHLYFCCENSVEAGPADRIPGIGLSNLQKRLTLLYPDRHDLKTGINNSIFKAELYLYL